MMTTVPDSGDREDLGTTGSELSGTSLYIHRTLSRCKSRIRDTESRSRCEPPR